MIFDKVTCLMIDKRINQQERIVGEFKEVGIDIGFFLAGNGTLSPAYTYQHIDVEPPVGRYGYPAWVNRPNSYNAFLCYKKILQEALKENISVQWLCEDDVTLLPNFKEILEQAEKELINLPEWDMLYLCANHTWCPTRLLSPHVLKLNGSGGFQFVGIKKRLFKWFLDAPLKAPIDEIAGKYAHPQFNCYAVWPNIAIPLPGESYCEGCFYDNTPLYKNRGC